MSQPETGWQYLARLTAKFLELLKGLWEILDKLIFRVLQSSEFIRVLCNSVVHTRFVVVFADVIAWC